MSSRLVIQPASRGLEASWEAWNRAQEASGSPGSPGIGPRKPRNDQKVTFLKPRKPRNDQKVTILVTPGYSGLPGPSRASPSAIRQPSLALTGTLAGSPPFVALPRALPTS